jgi:hypothetical protein
MGVLNVGRAALATALVLVGCGRPLEPAPTRSADVPITSPSTPAVDPSPIDPSGTWTAAVIAPPDDAAFRRAGDATGRIAGDRTVWAIDASGAWIPAQPFDDAAHWGIVEWRGGFVDWGQVASVRTSTDGVIWRDAAQGPAEANLSRMVPLGDRLLLVGEAVRARAGAWFSSDGSTWFEAPGAPLELWAVAAWPGHGIVASGGSGPSTTVWASADGTSWEAVATPRPPVGDPYVVGLGATANRVVAIGGTDERTAAWVSSDLRTWTEAPTAWGRDVSLATVTTIGGTFVIAGERSARPTLWLSADGLAWTSVDLPLAAGVDGGAAKVVAVGGRIVVFGSVTKDEGNGGSSRIADLIWTLTP